MYVLRCILTHVCATQESTRHCFVQRCQCSQGGSDESSSECSLFTQLRVSHQLQTQTLFQLVQNFSAGESRQLSSGRPSAEKKSLFFFQKVVINRCKRDWSIPAGLKLKNFQHWKLTQISRRSHVCQTNQDGFCHPHPEPQAIQLLNLTQVPRCQPVEIQDRWDESSTKLGPGCGDISVPPTFRQTSRSALWQKDPTGALDPGNFGYLAGEMSFLLRSCRTRSPTCR